MSPGSPRPESLRDTLLEVAIELFGEHGYAGASLQRIADRVGIRKSSIFHHFEGKAGLALAAYDQVAERAVERMEPLRREPPRLEHLLEYLDTAMVAAAEGPGAARLALRLLTDYPGPPRSVDPEDPASPSVRALGTLLGWFERARGAGAIRPVPPAHALLLVHGQLLLYPAAAHDVGPWLLGAEPAADPPRVQWRDPFAPEAVATWRKTTLDFVHRALTPDE